MGSAMSIHMPARDMVLAASTSKAMAMLPGLLELWLEAQFAPATAALLAANKLVFFRPGPLDGILPTYDALAFNWLRSRLMQPAQLMTVLSCFYHLNDNHLRGNMACLLHMGLLLELSMGTAAFASMVAALAGLSKGIAALLSKGMVLLGHGGKHYDYYSVGFSGVLFGMYAVLACSCSLAVVERCLWRMAVPAEYAGLLLKAARAVLVLAVSAELVILQARAPKVDFLAHLGGLLAGFLYHWLKKKLSLKVHLLVSRGIRSMALAARSAQEQLLSSAIIVTDNKQCRQTTQGSIGSRDGGDGREYRLRAP
ncbi:hypothetical protein U9M48_005116 [Paspalum notatum var. saurae]|uniref:Peptidase S54 rhomboid domain-containing protein n=1 Tax=Paspalum notatum var. saurae TaxID=547442 RepID=A0AAQ3PRG9_PASNO